MLAPNKTITLHIANLEWFSELMTDNRSAGSANLLLGTQLCSGPAIFCLILHPLTKRPLSLLGAFYNASLTAIDGALWVSTTVALP